MRTRIFRALVCLVLVAALLVQVSPIRAKATDNSPNFFYIDPNLQLASDLIGLGVSTGADSLAHTQVIQDAADWLAETGEWLSEGMLKVYKVAAAAGGFKYMVDADFLQELFEWMFDMEVVTSSFSGGLRLTANTKYSIGGSSVSVTPYSDVTAFGYTNSSESLVYVFLSAASSFKYKNGSSNNIVESSYVSTSGYYYIYTKASVSSMEALGIPVYKYTSDIGSQYVNFVDDFYNGVLDSSVGYEVSTSNDLTLNHVGTFGSILSDSYPEWFQNSTTITDSETGEEKTVVPVALGQTVTETQGMSQTDVWAGTSTYVDTETDVGTGDDTITVPETVTLKDIYTGILSVPKSIAQAVAAFFADVVAAVKAIPAAITEFFTISTDVSVYAVSITDFFPFCIPFDILDFLNVLDAEPEAPKFEWEIDLLKTGDPYLMVVDLSEWDEIAELLRNLELLLFIVGLASVTREKYIRC